MMLSFLLIGMMRGSSTACVRTLHQNWKHDVGRVLEIRVRVTELSVPTAWSDLVPVSIVVLDMRHCKLLCPVPCCIPLERAEHAELGCVPVLVSWKTERVSRCRHWRGRRASRMRTPGWISARLCARNHSW